MFGGVVIIEQQCQLLLHDRIRAAQPLELPQDLHHDLHHKRRSGERPEFCDG